jgi:hypothetical protein
MTTDDRTTEWMRKERRISGFDNGAKPVDSLRFPQDDYGQNCPQHYPQHADDLGEPLSVSQVARLLGCSVWTVRHAYLPQGLPHFRSGPAAKLVFFRNQIVQWILSRQQKGGN